MSALVEIRNISSVLAESHLKELFECCGPIKNMEMRRGEVGRVCLIEFENPSEAEAAALLSGTQLGDLQLTVERKSEDEVKKLREKSDKVAGGESEDEVQKALRKMQELAQPGTGVPVAEDATPAEVAQQTEKQRIEAQRRDNELARTIYVGNLNALVTEEHIKAIFKSCGEVLYIKMSAQNQGSQVRYCFVEFDSAEAAQRAFALQGTPLGDRPLKIGRATTPIVKSTISTSTNILTNPVRLRNAMEHVRAALNRIKDNHTTVKGSSSRSRSRSRKRRRRRSRSRSRSHRRRKRRRTRSRSRSRDRRRRYGSGGGGTDFWRRGGLARGRGEPKKDMIWDGFQWHPRDSREGQTTAAAVARSNAGEVASQREFRDWAPSASQAPAALAEAVRKGEPIALGTEGPPVAINPAMPSVASLAAQAVKAQQAHFGQFGA